MESKPSFSCEFYQRNYRCGAMTTISYTHLRLQRTPPSFPLSPPNLLTPSLSLSNHFTIVNTHAAIKAPVMGPRTGIKLYDQSLSLLFLIGRIKCAIRGARSRAGLIA